MQPFRFAALVSHPIQHISPIFQQLSGIPGFDVKVFYICDHGMRESYDHGFDTKFAWDLPLTEGHAHVFLRPGFSPSRFSFFELDAPDILRHLDEFRPHGVWLHGYGQRLSWRALRWARKNNAALVHFGDSELLHRRALAAKILKRLALPYYFQQCDAFVTIGDNNEAYYRSYGVPEEKMFRGAYPIDVERFSAAADALTAEQRSTTRAKFGIPENAFVAITSGKLESRKRPLDVVEAVASLEKDQPNLHAMMIGDGHLREEVMSRARSLGVEQKIHITGFVNQRDIPLVVASGDVLVMASDYDPHPLAVTEALPAGLPIVASDLIGCVGPTDTARPDVNALVYRCGDVKALAGSLRSLMGDTALCGRLGEASRKIAATQGTKVTVDALLRALLSCREDLLESGADFSREVFGAWEQYLVKSPAAAN